MNAEQAVDYIYASYMKAEPYLDYQALDREKRNPLLSKAIIEKRSGTDTVLVTGSKGKGSVAKMIAEIMGVHKKTGLMTSPHILHFEERFQVQGQCVSGQELAAAVEQVKPEFDLVQQKLSDKEYISPMAIQTAAALELFYKKQAAFQVLECGKGAAYDDVNNVVHKYAVINRIFLEHTRELGTTLEEIAENKAAIITGDQKAVFISEQDPTVLSVFEKRAKAFEIPLYQYGKDFWCENIRYTNQGMCFDVITRSKRYEDIRIPLLGSYQAKNCAMAFALCEEVLPYMKLSEVREALKRLSWPGRLEVLCNKPLILLDACINRASCANVLEALRKLHIPKITSVIGIPCDKDFQGVCEEMQDISECMLLTKSSNPHYKFSKQQVTELAEKGIATEWTENVEEALQKAAACGNPVCILGTTSLISDVKKYWEDRHETSDGI